MMQVSKALTEFTKVLHTPATKKDYLFHLNKYLAWSNRETYDDLVNQEIEKIQASVEDYLEFLQNEKHSTSYLRLAVSSLALFFGMNYKEINKTRLRKMIEPEGRLGGGQAYTNEDVKKILLAVDKTKLTKRKKKPYPSKTKTRTRAMIHFLAACGCRGGALNQVALEDLEKIENCYCVKIYANSRYEYNTFLTPQATKALDEWLKEFREYWKDREYKIYSRRGKPEILRFEEIPIFPLTEEALRLHLNRIVRRAGLNQNKNRLRYDKPLTHAFRKRWNTIMKSNKEINPNLIELMLGHTPEIQLDIHYLKPTKELLFEEYKKGIEQLEIKF